MERNGASVQKSSCPELNSLTANFTEENIFGDNDRAR